MVLGDRLGLVGVILALLGIAFTYLWPDKKWIGWLSLSVAVLLIAMWGWLEFKPQFVAFYQSYPIKSTILVFLCGGLLSSGLWLRITARTPTEVAPDETKPNFVFGVGDSVNTYVPDKDQTMMFIDAQILNRGANSAVIFHQPHYKSPTLDSDVNMLSLSQPRAIVFPNENKTLILKHANLITTKVASGLLKGQSARGRLAIGIPGDRLKEIGSGATVTFTIEDFTGKPYLITYQSGPSDSTMRLTIADDEEVEEKARDITPATPLPKPSVTVMAYLQPAAPYDVQILAGIMWQKQYVDVRLDLANGAAAIRNLDFVVRLDTSIAGIGQLSQFPGITAFPAKSMSPAWLQGTDPQGNAVAVPLTPIPGTMSTAPVYRVHCSELFANTVVHLVIASIAINQPTAQGGMPQQLFAPRRAPKTIQIKGQYTVQDGTSLKSYPLEFSYQFPQQTLEAPKETPKESAKLQFTFWPINPNDEKLRDEISLPAVNGVVTVTVSAKNIGTAQADNGQIWIQLCDDCTFAEEPEGSTAPKDDPTVRRKHFDILHMGSYFEGTTLKIAPRAGLTSFKIALKYSCEHCPPVENKHPQTLKVNIVEPAAAVSTPPASKVQAQLTDSPPDIIPRDPVKAVEVVDRMRRSIAAIIGKKDTVTFLITYPKDDNSNYVFVSNLISQACRVSPRQCWFTGEGNPQDLDKPAVQASGRPGITVHGTDAFALANALGAWFIAHSTSIFPPELNGYNEYHTKEIMWIEIGPGSLWKTANH
ncbi:MAG TPA: hypothetical protein VFF64_22680 [Candidatus Eremiobacteraceae bacterium]|nr:hypothetical protein [Candidatus Eremiobacteraceae bacterium]